MTSRQIRPEDLGRQGSLFELEAEIMEIVWSAGWPRISVADVHARLRSRRGLAYTTVMTTLSRLHDKGVLERERDGRRYLYVPRVDRETFLRSTAREVMARLVEASEHGAQMVLGEAVALADEAALDRLEAFVRERRRALQG
jgi:predicted transcriptional regulator